VQRGLAVRRERDDLVPYVFSLSLNQPMPDRRSLSTGTPWERAFAYRRAVRVGSLVFVSGTTGVGDDGRVVEPDDAHAQARRAFARIEAALGALGASLGDVVRTRMFVTDIARDGDAVGRAHGEVFGPTMAATGHAPVATMVEVRALIDPAMRVEIEADAVVGDAIAGSPGDDAEAVR